MDAFCSVCGKGWDMRDPEVMHLSLGDEWFCRDESACRARRAVISAELDHSRHPYQPRKEP